MPRDYDSDKYRGDGFDYEEARRDLRDAGLDPDYLNSRNRAERDSFMRKNGFDPKRYGSRYSGTDKNKASDDGCFLTSACVAVKGLRDDCPELQILRAYRDTYLALRENGRADIEEYYAVAPRIVRGINARPDAESVWSELYERLVLPCVTLIRNGENEAAYRLYKETTLGLKTKFC